MTVHVQYHEDRDSWWAESPELDGWTAAAATLSELRALVREAVALLAPKQSVVVEQGLPA
jgi:predicted RNase H-like HicB family nuclease